MTKIKKVLIEEDRLNKPKYLETFEHKGFVYFTNPSLFLVQFCEPLP